MRLGWQCPTCFAELGDKTHARVLTCPFCGSLLIVDKKKKKFYLAKKDRGWYFFPKKYLGENTGYLRFGEHEEYYNYKNGEWYLIKGNKKYKLEKEFCECNGKVIEKGEINYIWGELPILAIPEMELQTIECNEGICKKSSKGEYFFISIQ